MTYPDQPPSDVPVNYVSASRYGKAPGQIKLAAIFTLISACLTVVGVLYMVGMTFFMPYFMTHSTAMGGVPTTLPFPSWVLSVIYGLFAVIAVGVAIIKFIGGVKLLRGGTHPWGWGMTASILGCVEVLWCSVGCILPLAGAIYCIVVLAQSKTQEYLRDRPNLELPADDSPFAR